MEKEDRFSASRSDDGRYRLLIEAITDYAIYMLDPTGIVTSWNPGAHRFKGYEAADIIGSHFSLFYTDQDRAAGQPANALATAAREGKFEGEGWRVRKDGSHFWAHVVIDPVLSPSGKLLGFAKITRDLTQRQAAETALKRSEEQFQLLIQSVTDYAIYMLDTTGHVASWNPGAQRIKGYLPAEILGSHFSRFYTPEDRKNGEPQRALETATKFGRYEKEGLRVRKDGTTFDAHVVIDPIRDQSGTLMGFAKVTRDITEKKLAQRQIEQTREALYQSQKMDAIGQLTGGIAHDFNNLLMAIQSSLSLAKKRMHDGAQLAKLLDNAAQAAQRGTTLTQRMLAFARRQSMELKPIELPLLVRGMIEMLQRSIDPAVIIETRFPLNLSRVLADENQLEMALLNLTVNARDAMADGGTIIFSATDELIGPGHPTRLPAGHYVRLAVTDQGEGMDPETLARATEPFFTTKGIGKGTGLGLPMVHGMTEQSGGRFVLKSRKGEGTTAEIWLPIANIGANDSGTEAAGPGLPQIRPLNILAVDDDPLVLFNTVEMLVDLGHSAVAAASAKDALQKIEQRSFDLVITDQAMPGMSGLQLIHEIRCRQPGLKTILATGYAELPKGAEEGLQKLKKPFGESDLARALLKAIA